MRHVTVTHFIAVTAAVGVALMMLTAATGVQAADTIGPNHIVQPGDALRLFVFDHPDLSASYSVGPGGYINIPLIGPVKVTNHTLSELQQRLRRELSQVLRDPYLTVAIDEQASQRKVTVTGYVERAGAHTLPIHATVRDAVIGAGFTDHADLRNIELRREGQPYQTIDLSGLRLSEDLGEPVTVQWGDIIHVPRLVGRISVLGEVNSPSSITVPIGQTVTVLEAIKQVGGGLAAQANPNSARLLREGSSRPVEIDLHALLKEGDISQNHELHSGDVLLVEKGEPVTIFGAVNNPTTFHIDEPIQLVEGIIRAGGFSSISDMENAELIRDGTHTPVNLEKLWKSGDLSQNIQLQSGDFLSVPEKEPEEVLLLGALNQRGAMDIAQMENTSLLKIVLMAGPTEAADLSQVQVYREEGTIVRNLRQMEKEGDLSQDIQLQPGDVVVVRDLEKVYILGAFGSPGMYPYREDWTLIDYLTRAGLGQEVDIRKGVLVRPRSGDMEEAEVFEINFEKLKQGELPNLEVLPGDIIFFAPPKRGRTLLQYLRDYLWLLSLPFFDL
ncbi:MAG: SLBB domain-containing protein [Armatimonadota bacterium]